LFAGNKLDMSMHAALKAIAAHSKEGKKYPDYYSASITANRCAEVCYATPKYSPVGTT